MIGVEAGGIVTRSLVRDCPPGATAAVADPARDLAKVAVIERHRGTGRIGLGLVTGFGLRRGALASTHAHDAHNLVVVGVDDADMAAAANRLAEIGGGQVAVVGGRVVAEVRCPIGGLLSDLPVEQVAAAVRSLEEAAARELGATLPAPIMTMSFLALSVIPELKISDLGLIDTVAFEVVPIEVPASSSASSLCGYSRAGGPGGVGRVGCGGVGVRRRPCVAPPRAATPVESGRMALGAGHRVGR